MFQNSTIALVATPFDYIGLALALIIIVGIAIYVFVMVQRVVALPERKARARLEPGNQVEDPGLAREDIEAASMRLDEKKLQEEPVHTREGHDEKP